MSAKSLRYIPSLDGLRGLAAILVLATHYGYSEVGWIGLEFFFVLSGFLITSILLTERNRRLGEYLGRFYWRRLLRTFPAYFGFLLVCAAVYVCVRQPQGFLHVLPSLAAYWYNFDLISNPDHQGLCLTTTHLWSMSVEEQFYLVWPLLVFVLSGANLRRVIVAIVVLIPLLRLALFAYYHLNGEEDSYTTYILHLATPFHLDAFSIGAGIAVFRLTERELKLRWFFLAGGCVLLLGLVNASIGQYPYDLMPYVGVQRIFLRALSFGYPQFLLQNRQFLWGYSVIDLLAATLIICASQQNALQRFCENRFLWHLGRISYGFYIFHLPILLLFYPILPTNRWSLTGAAFFVLLVAITIGAAHLSYFYFERRFLMMKDYFAKRKAGPIAPPVIAGTPPAAPG